LLGCVHNQVLVVHLLGYTVGGGNYRPPLGEN
jgi:hypothetical protein